MEVNRMEIKEFKQYTNNLNQYSASEIDEFAFMTEAELDSYQSELEYDSGNLSDWDHLRAFITLKKKVAELEKII